LRYTFCAIQIELFPFRYPITSATEYFGEMVSAYAGGQASGTPPVLALPCRMVQVIMIL